MPPSFGTTQGSSKGGIDENDRNYTANEGMNCSLLKRCSFREVFPNRTFSKIVKTVPINDNTTEKIQVGIF